MLLIKYLDQLLNLYCNKNKIDFDNKFGGNQTSIIRLTNTDSTVIIHKKKIYFSMENGINGMV